jgi:tetratricopeptide (TPR) repeat protein/DNA-binding CsgD family transcriptional regulator
VQAATDDDDDVLDAALGEAIAGHVLKVGDGGHLQFRHELQREVLYESLLPTERERLHRRLADVLRTRAELRASDPVQVDVDLAYHAWEAGEWPTAMRAAMRAGNAMVELLAIPEGYAQYERAIAAYDRCAPADREDVDRVDLLVDASDLAYLVGETARAVELAKTALADVDPGAQPERVAVALTIYGRHAFVSGDVEGAFDAFERARALLPPDRSTRECARVVAQEAACLMILGRADDAVARSREAIEIARGAGARASEGHALCTLGVCLVERGDVETGIDHAREALRIAEEMGLPLDIERAYTNLSHVLMISGRLDEGAGLVKTTTGEWATGIRLNAAGLNSAEILIRLGRYDDAAELLGRMSERGTGNCVYGPYALQTLLALRRGRLDDATTHLESADRYFAGTPAPQGRGIAHLRRAELLLERDRPDDAYGEIEQALTDVAATDDHVIRPEICAVGVRALVERHDAARSRGRTIDVDKLTRLATTLVEQAQRDLDALTRPGGVAPPVPYALVAQCEAEATGLAAPDPDRWHNAVAAWTEAGDMWSAAYCGWREAQAALATPNHRADAIAAATSAWKTASGIGAATLVAWIERLAQRARIELPSGDLPSDANTVHVEIAENLGITAREVDVLDQLARGRTDRQIADALFISKKTVSVHVSSILRKLDAGNRIDAGEIGQRAGLGQ